MQVEAEGQPGPGAGVVGPPAESRTIMQVGNGNFPRRRILLLTRGSRAHQVVQAEAGGGAGPEAGGGAGP